MEKLRNNFKDSHGHFIRIVILIFVIALAFGVSGIVKDSEFVSGLVRQFGYAGIFLVAVVSGFNLVIPVPAISFLPVFLASGLNAFAVIVIIAAGMSLADFVGFLLGKTGRHIAQGVGSFKKDTQGVRSFKREDLTPSFLKYLTPSNRADPFQNWSPALVLFLFASFIPLPNEVLVVPMAFLGYRFTYILLPVFFGNMVFNSLYAIGVVNILKLLN